jgi:hypothetical protein
MDQVSALLEAPQEDSVEREVTEEDQKVQVSWTSKSKMANQGN